MNRKLKYSTATVIDLHLHSNRSDGMLGPKRLAHLCKDCNIGLAALSDHDTDEAIGTFIYWATKLGIRVLPAIEFTSFFKGIEVHVLGYNIRHGLSSLNGLLRGNIEARKKRIDKTLEIMGECGIIETTQKEITDWCEYKGPVISIMQVAKFISHEKKIDFFEAKKLCKRSGIAWVPLDHSLVLSMEEAIRIITSELKGIAVLAHPIKILKHASYHEELYEQNAWHFLYNLMAYFRESGGLGVEIGHPTHNRMQQENLVRMANELGMFKTVGSDYHGFKNEKPGVAGSKMEDYLEFASIY